MTVLFSHSPGLEVLAVLSQHFSVGKASCVASEDWLTTGSVFIPALPLDEEQQWIVLRNLWPRLYVQKRLAHG